MGGGKGAWAGLGGGEGRGGDGRWETLGIPCLLWLQRGVLQGGEGKGAKEPSVERSSHSVCECVCVCVSLHVPECRRVRCWD